MKNYRITAGEAKPLDIVLTEQLGQALTGITVEAALSPADTVPAAGAWKPATVTISGSKATASLLVKASDYQPVANTRAWARVTDGDRVYLLCVTSEPITLI